MLNSYVLYRMVLFLVTLSDPNYPKPLYALYALALCLSIHLSVASWYGTRMDKHRLIGTCMHCIKCCYFQRPWVTLSTQATAFLPREATIARYILCSCVYTSVCHKSVLPKWLQHKIKLTTPHSSAWTLVFWCQISQQISCEVKFILISDLLSCLILSSTSAWVIEYPQRRCAQSHVTF